jgi:hypothetical protein
LNTKSIDQTFSFALFYAMPVAAGGALAVRWRQLTCQARAQGLVVVTSSSVFLAQSMHRADIGHLMQSAAAALLALGWLWRTLPTTRARFVIVAVMAVAGFVGIVHRSYAINAPESAIKALRDSSVDRSAWRELLVTERPNSSAAKLQRLFVCLPAAWSVAIFPFAPQMAYLADRRFAGDTLLIAPGYFESPAHQQRMIQGLERDQPAVVLWDQNSIFDGMQKRNTIYTHSGLWHHVTKSMRYSGEVGSYHVYAKTIASDKITRDCLAR